MSKKNHRRKNSQTGKIIKGIVGYNKYLKRKSAETTIVKIKLALKRKRYQYLTPPKKKDPKPWSNKKEMKTYKKEITRKRKGENDNK